MSTFSFNTVLHWSRIFVCIALGLTVGGLNARAQTEVAAANTNRMSPIWAAIYGAQDIDPNADPDGDGLSNWQEAVAGTDPFDAGSAPRISSFTVTNKTAQVRILGALGKCYELQATETICGRGGESNLWVAQAAV